MIECNDDFSMFRFQIVSPEVRNKLIGEESFVTFKAPSFVKVETNFGKGRYLVQCFFVTPEDKDSNIFITKFYSNRMRFRFPFRNKLFRVLSNKILMEDLIVQKGVEKNVNEFGAPLYGKAVQIDNVNKMYLDLHQRMMDYMDPFSKKK